MTPGSTFDASDVERCVEQLRREGRLTLSLDRQKLQQQQQQQQHQGGPPSSAEGDRQLMAAVAALQQQQQQQQGQVTQEFFGVGGGGGGGGRRSPGDSARFVSRLEEGRQRPLTAPPAARKCRPILGNAARCTQSTTARER